MKTTNTHRDVSNDLYHDDEQTLLQQAKGRILVFALGGPLIFESPRQSHGSMRYFLITRY